MFKKLSSLVLSGALTLGILSGCAPKKEEAPAKSNDGKEITLMIPEWGVPSDEMLEEFKKESGITVKVLPTSWDDVKSKVSIASAAKKAPADVFEVDWSWVGEFQSAGWLEKVEMDEAVIKDMPSISSFMVDGGVYAVPYSNDVRICYMNKEMAKKAGITEAPKTWDELDMVMKKMKETKAAEYPLLFPLSAEEKLSTSFFTVAYLRNGVVFNDDDTLNKESTLETLKLIDKYVKDGIINPNDITAPGIDTFKGLNAGNGAFLIGPSSYISSSNDEKVSKVVGQVESIPMPSKNGPADKAIAFTEAVGVSPFSENKEAAMEFMKWFYKPETQIKLNKAINNIPTRTSVLEQIVKDGTLKNPGTLIETNKMVSSPFPNGVPKYYTKMSTEIFNTINQMAQGKLTPEAATDALVNKVNAIVKENK